MVPIASKADLRNSELEVFPANSSKAATAPFASCPQALNPFTAWERRKSSPSWVWKAVFSGGLLGMSGAGKSVTVCDLLSQTEGYFAYTVIIEEGLSYGIYTATVEEGARPIIIHPDGDLTINYLDTKGLPLTPDHLSAATALVARMIGTSTQEDKQMLRQAQIAKYINLLYEDAFQDWCKKRHDQLLDIARHALALQRFRAERMPPGATSLETFADFRDWKASHPDEAESYQRQFDEAAALKFLKEPKTSKEVRNLAFAYFTPDEFPTHRM